MPAVFVHGVPETPSLWDDLRKNLHRDDVIALQLPGFGCARPAGFSATKEEYVAWLVRELEGLQAQGPIDLVGHDWGAGFTVRLVTTRPDLIRSWVTDAAGIGNVNFEWHDFAKIWQTPGDGEAFFEQQMTASIEERASVFELMFAVPHDAAVALVTPADETMAACILDLYRSAVNVGKEWGPDFHDIPKPGCVLLASEDPFLPVDVSRQAALRAGATLTELDGLGHWWMLQDPARGAAAIEAFWATLA
jgi:pimeloyl-ACP methyl ester carboxylesterase